MILLLSDKHTSAECAGLLSRQHGDMKIIQYQQENFSTEPAATRLFIIDLLRNDYFSETFFPELLAFELINKQLPPTVSDIYLLVTSLDDSIKTITWGNRLAAAFLQNHQRTIRVHVLAKLEYDSVKFGFSINDMEWKIEGINFVNSIPNSEELKIDYLDTQLIWAGNNIVNYLDNPEQICTGIAYGWR